MINKSNYSNDPFVFIDHYLRVYKINKYTKVICVEELNRHLSNGGSSDIGVAIYKSIKLERKIENRMFKIQKILCK